MQRKVSLLEILEGDRRLEEVLDVARRVLAQDRYLLRDYPHAEESHIVAAFADGECIGFLRFLVQVIGADVGGSPIGHQGRELTEGFVEAFGVLPDERRGGVGTALQQWASEYCRKAGCYQMRSRSPTSSTENHALKLEAGYTVHPSDKNESYYFMRKL